MKLFRTMEVTEDTFKVGDVIGFALNDGEEVEALAVKQEEDGMVFITVDCLSKEQPMNATNTNRGGYEHSYLRGKLNGEILDNFPAEIRDKMVAFPNGDMVRLPTECEIIGKNVWGAGEEPPVEQWEPMKQRKNRIAFKSKGSDKWGWYWLQNKVDGYHALFTYVDAGGMVYYINATVDYGVRPVFKLTGHIF